ncbi:hypothetical protein F4680DRAFT_69706 [Xylaria scruposa]|nr:hypothetical protein F4680DRAFT_69706 [Xylaria scruposa]
MGSRSVLQHDKLHLSIVLGTIRATREATSVLHFDLAFPYTDTIEHRTIDQEASSSETSRHKPFMPRCAQRDSHVDKCNAAGASRSVPPTHVVRRC